VAGPAVLAHMVDSVLWFEGNRESSLRILRAVKNRFGPTDEVGIFTMKEEGLVPATSKKLFVSGVRKNVPGSCLAMIMEGTRPVIVEIQSLTMRSRLAFPKRTVQGADVRKVELLLAILTRRAGLRLDERDVFVNVVGGIKIKEPAADLALGLSLASAYFDKPLPKKLVAIGELGLLGEVRAVASQEKRLKEAKRLGYPEVLINNLVKYLQQAITRYLR